jgi:hypothetical protein
MKQLRETKKRRSTSLYYVSFRALKVQRDHEERDKGPIRRDVWLAVCSLSDPAVVASIAWLFSILLV